MKKIFYSLFSIGVISAIVVSASNAFFSDTEISSGNMLVAGKVDLLADSECTYNDQPSFECGVWESKSLTSEKFFNFSDVKPGDYGENTISLKVDNNPSWLCMTMTPTANDDVTSTETELNEGGESPEIVSDLWDGELRQNMTFHIWADVCDTPPAVPGDNIYQAGCDRNITESISDDSVALTLADTTQNVFSGNTGEPISGNQNYHLGFGWSLPGSVGNIVQTDNFIVDISFQAEQARNNSTFVCKNQFSFSDNFNDGNIDGWEIIGSHKVPSDFGNWKVVNGELFEQTGGDGYMILFGNNNYSSQTLESKVKFVDPAGYGGFVTWFQDYNNLIYVRLYPGAGQIWIEQKENGVSNITTYPYSSAYDTWYDLKTEIDSSSGEVKVYVNGSNIVNHVVATLKRSGRTGLMDGNSGAYFDDFKLTSN